MLYFFVVQFNKGYHIPLDGLKQKIEDWKGEINFLHYEYISGDDGGIVAIVDVLPKKGDTIDLDKKLRQKMGIYMGQINGFIDLITEEYIKDKAGTVVMPDEEKNFAHWGRVPLLKLIKEFQPHEDDPAAFLEDSAYVIGKEPGDGLMGGSGGKH